MNTTLDTGATDIATDTGANVPMVPAGKIVAVVATTTARLVGAGTIAKQAGKTIGHVKAAHAQKQGSSGTMLAAIAGKNRAGTIAALAEQRMASLVNHAGEIDYSAAMREIVGALPYAYAYEESVRADGARVVKRASWLALGEFLQVEAGKRGKTGKPTPNAKASADGFKVWQTIANTSEKARNIYTAKLG
jgi:hypothetical protein